MSIPRGNSQMLLSALNLRYSAYFVLWKFCARILGNSWKAVTNFQSYKKACLCRGSNTGPLEYAPRTLFSEPSSQMIDTIWKISFSCTTHDAFLFCAYATRNSDLPLFSKSEKAVLFCFYQLSVRFVHDFCTLCLKNQPIKSNKTLKNQMSNAGVRFLQ